MPSERRPGPSAKKLSIRLRFWFCSVFNPVAGLGESLQGMHIAPASEAPPGTFGLQSYFFIFYLSKYILVLQQEQQ